MKAGARTSNGGLAVLLPREDAAGYSLCPPLSLASKAEFAPAEPMIS
jgi:hypothetical protein